MVVVANGLVAPLTAMICPHVILDGPAINFALDNDGLVRHIDMADSTRKP
jgi:hypothetical protein